MSRYAIHGQCSPTSVVTVYEEDGTTLATIYEALTGGSAVSGSQITADSTGKATFYVESGDYPFMYLFNLLITKSGYDDVTIENVWSSFYSLLQAETPVSVAASLYSDLTPQIQRNWGRSDASSLNTIIFYLNAAKRLLAASYDAPELQVTATPTLVASTRTYSIASDWGLTNLNKIYSITLSANSRGYDLKYYPPKKWDVEIWPVIPNAADDIPRMYTQWEGDVIVHPAPNSAYPTYLRYYRWPINATALSTSVEFLGMDMVLVEITTGFCFFSIEDYAVGRQHFSIAEGLLKKLGIDVEYSKDLHMSAGGGVSAPGQYWNNPFEQRSP